MPDKKRAFRGLMQIHDIQKDVGCFGFTHDVGEKTLFFESHVVLKLGNTYRCYFMLPPDSRLQILGEISKCLEIEEGGCGKKTLFGYELTYTDLGDRGQQMINEFLGLGLHKQGPATLSEDAQRRMREDYPSPKQFLRSKKGNFRLKTANRIRSEKLGELGRVHEISTKEIVIFSDTVIQPSDFENLQVKIQLYTLEEDLGEVDFKVRVINFMPAPTMTDTAIHHYYTMEFVDLNEQQQNTLNAVFASWLGCAIKKPTTKIPENCYPAEILVMMNSSTEGGPLGLTKWISHEGFLISNDDMHPMAKPFPVFFYIPDEHQSQIVAWVHEDENQIKLNADASTYSHYFKFVNFAEHESTIVTSLKQLDAWLDKVLPQPIVNSNENKRDFKTSIIQSLSEQPIGTSSWISLKGLSMVSAFEKFDDVPFGIRFKSPVNPDIYLVTIVYDARRTKNPDNTYTHYLQFVDNMGEDCKRALQEFLEPTDNHIQALTKRLKSHDPDYDRYDLPLTVKKPPQFDGFLDDTSPTIGATRWISMTGLLLDGFSELPKDTEFPILLKLPIDQPNTVECQAKVVNSSFDSKDKVWLSELQLFNFKLELDRIGPYPDDDDVLRKYLARYPNRKIKTTTPDETVTIVQPETPDSQTQDSPFLKMIKDSLVEIDAIEELAKAVIAVFTGAVSRGKVISWTSDEVGDKTRIIRWHHDFSHIMEQKPFLQPVVRSLSHEDEYNWLSSNILGKLHKLGITQAANHAKAQFIVEDQKSFHVVLEFIVVM